MEAVPLTQSALWNSTGATAWIDMREPLDQMFQEIETQLVAGVAPGQHVLDVGCGTGGTTLALARKTGRATGIDISAPMIAVAQARADEEGTAAQFASADAGQADIGEAVYDAIVSRFGVMFFDDPVAAFANLRRAARVGAVLRFFAWRAPEENPYMTAAEQAVAALLPPQPPRPPDGPGQFSFASGERVRHILASAGWQGIQLKRSDVPCAFPRRDLERYATLMGPVGRVLPQLDAAARDAIVAQAVAAFAPFVDGDTVRYTAACWDVTATAG